MTPRLPCLAAFLSATALAACGSVPAPDGPPGSDVGHVTFASGDAVFRIEARTGASPENLSARLTAGSRAADRRVNLSPAGTRYVFETGNLGCETGTCLAIAPVADLGAATLVRVGGAPIDAAESRSAVDDGGSLVVFAATGGPHERDLYATRDDGSGWSAPVLLTADSPYAWNDTPSLSADASHVLFDCGPTANAGAGGSICEVGTDGSELGVVLTPDDAPAGTADAGPLHHAVYDGEDVVFEAAWDGERIWRMGGAGLAPIADGANNDNSPCVLPDGRIASVYLGRDGNTSGRHELKVMAADGSAPLMLVLDRDLTDEGLGCGP